MATSHPHFLYVPPGMTFSREFTQAHGGNAHRQTDVDQNPREEYSEDVSGEDDDGSNWPDVRDQLFEDLDLIQQTGKFFSWFLPGPFPDWR